MPDHVIHYSTAPRSAHGAEISIQILPSPGFDPWTSYLAVQHATVRPPRTQNCSKKIFNRLNADEASNNARSVTFYFNYFLVCGLPGFLTYLRFVYIYFP